MNNVEYMTKKFGVPVEDVFELILGEKNAVLPGKTWYAYGVICTDDEMICCNAGEQTEFRIPFSSFSRAEFGIGSGNLWLQTVTGGNSLVFCARRKMWKSPAGKKLIERISAVTPVLDMKAYDQFTGKLWFFAMFK